MLFQTRNSIAEGGDVKGRHVLTFFAVFVFLAGNACESFAQNEVTLLSPSPLREEFEKLIPGFESKTKSKVTATWGTGVSTRNDVAAGKALDVCILYSPFNEAVGPATSIAAAGNRS